MLDTEAIDFNDLDEMKQIPTRYIRRIYDAYEADRYRSLVSKTQKRSAMNVLAKYLIQTPADPNYGPPIAEKLINNYSDYTVRWDGRNKMITYVIKRANGLAPVTIKELVRPAVKAHNPDKPHNGPFLRSRGYFYPNRGRVIRSLIGLPNAKKLIAALLNLFNTKNKIKNCFELLQYQFNLSAKSKAVSQYLFNQVATMEFIDKRWWSRELGKSLFYNNTQQARRAFKPLCKNHPAQLYNTLIYRIKNENSGKAKKIRRGLNRLLDIVYDDEVKTLVNI